MVIATIKRMISGKPGYIAKKSYLIKADLLRVVKQCYGANGKSGKE
jgi:hypothetical protein